MNIIIHFGLDGKGQHKNDEAGERKEIFGKEPRMSEVGKSCFSTGCAELSVTRLKTSFHLTRSFKKLQFAAKLKLLSENFTTFKKQEKSRQKVLRERFYGDSVVQGRNRDGGTGRFSVFFSRKCQNKRSKARTTSEQH